MSSPRARVVHRQSSQVDEQLENAVRDGDILTLAGGVPADDLFPADSIRAAMDRAMDDGPEVLQYGYPIGLDRLRQWIVAWMAGRGVTLGEDQVLVTSGAQQGLGLLGTLLVPERSPVVVEAPTYVAALQALDLRKPTFLRCSRTADGLDLDALEAALRDASVAYVVPSGHNPTGDVLDRGQREDLVEIAARAGAWVIDDDAYGEVQFDRWQPPLRSVGEHLDRIVHLGSFSKVLAPGLRVGWIAGPPDLIRQATLVKQAMDLETATLTQRVLAWWLADNSLEDHVERCLPVYRSRRDALLDALGRWCRDLGTWDVPRGGFSLLFRPHAEVDAGGLLREGLRAGVAWEPAAPYYPGGGGESHIRLSFGNVREPDIAEAVRRFAGVLRTS